MWYSDTQNWRCSPQLTDSCSFGGFVLWQGSGISSRVKLPKPLYQAQFFSIVPWFSNALKSVFLSQNQNSLYIELGFLLHKILEITFCQKSSRFPRNSGKTRNSAYWLVSIVHETSEFSSLYFPKLK